jgi:hypothetical protein
MMRVEVLPDRSGAFAFSTPSVVMNLAGFDTGSPFAPDWDISLDDQRFLMVALEGDHRPRASLTVVTNWFDELRSRVKGN